MKNSKEAWTSFLYAVNRVLVNFDNATQDDADEAEAKFVDYLMAKAEEEQNADPQSHTD